MIAFTIDDEGNQKMEMSGNKRSNDQIDVSDIPRFSPPGPSFAEAVSPVIIDFGLLALYSFIFFTGVLIALIKYDVR